MTTISHERKFNSNCEIEKRGRMNGKMEQKKKEKKKSTSKLTLVQKGHWCQQLRSPFLELLPWFSCSVNVPPLKIVSVEF